VEEEDLNVPHNLDLVVKEEPAVAIKRAGAIKRAVATRQVDASQPEVMNP